MLVQKTTQRTIAITVTVVTQLIPIGLLWHGFAECLPFKDPLLANAYLPLLFLIAAVFPLLLHHRVLFLAPIISTFVVPGVFLIAYALITPGPDLHLGIRGYACDYPLNGGWGTVLWSILEGILFSVPTSIIASLLLAALQFFGKRELNENLHNGT